MSTWVWSAQIGLFMGLLVFALVFVPIVVVQYRRYGRISKGRLLGAAAVSIYVAAIASYTWLPLPTQSSEAWCAAYGVQELQLRPFAFADDITAAVSDVGWRAALTSREVLQVVFNVVLFVPWGVLVRGYLQRPAWVAILTGALASLFVEVTQATGLWFIYPCAYRVADVDDLLTNTLGAVIGAAIAPLFLFWMPRREALAADRLVPRKITAWRRILSMFITWAGVSLLAGALSAVVRFVYVVLGGDPMVPSMHWVDFGLFAFAVLLLIYVPAVRGRGSFGQQTVWLAPRWPGRDGELGIGPWWLRILRASVAAVPMLLASAFSGNAADTPLQLIAAASVVMAPFTATKRALSGWLTRATMIDVRSELPED